MPRAPKRPERYLVRVSAPGFVAGLVIARGFCTEAAPVLRFAEGKSAAWLSGHFQHRGWRAAIVPWQADLLRVDDAPEQPAA